MQKHRKNGYMVERMREKRRGKTKGGERRMERQT